MRFNKASVVPFIRGENHMRRSPIRHGGLNPCGQRVDIRPSRSPAPTRPFGTIVRDIERFSGHTTAVALSPIGIVLTS